MDFDDLDEPVEVIAPQSKPSKFAPKSSNLPQKQKPKQETTTLLKPEVVGDDQPATTFKKEKDSDTIKTEFKNEMDDFGLDSFETTDFMEEDLVEDYVVSEVDVYFNRHPIDDGALLYVLQYPLRQSWRTYELDKNCTEVRLKPHSSDLQVDLSIDLESGYFSQATAASLGFTKLMLASGPRPHQRAAYTIGVLVDQKLHLNPVQAIRQLKPSLDHLDKLDSKNQIIPEVSKKEAGSSGGGKAAGSSGGSSGKKDQAKNQANGQRGEEMWVPLRYHGSRTSLSLKYLQKMRAGTSSPLEFPMKPIDYLKSFSPGAAISKRKQSGPSIKSLLSFSLEERFKLRLAQGPPIQKFSTLKYLSGNDTMEDVFRVLQELAVLVQGYWVPKTPVRYPNADANLSLARDSALLLFSRNPVIKDSVLDDMKNKVRDTMKNKALPELAIYRKKCQDWKFKEPTDSPFLKLYPEIVCKQNQKWQDVEKPVLAAVFKEKNALSHKSSATIDNSGRGAALEKSGGVKSACSAAPPLRRVMSDQTREALPKVLKKLFQNQKVWSFQTICQGLRDMAVSMSSLPKADAKVAVSAAHGVDAPEELLEIINDVAVNIHGAFVLRSSSEHPEFDPLRNVVIDLFIGRGPNGKVRRAEIVEASKIRLQREPTNDEFRKVISEFCVTNGSAWVMKSVDGPPI